LSAYVFDASAVLALIFGEPGGDVVAEHLEQARISSVNWSEVGAKVAERGGDLARFLEAMRASPLTISPFDREQAEQAALLRCATRKHGLSLGDRACLALAKAHNATALTTDREWERLDVGVAVRLIR
jgi:PIN domain nuclease of toxin-antitoxin system